MDKELYRLHAKLPIFRRHVERSFDIVRQVRAITGTWALSISGGKDSVAMLDLCIRAGWRGPLFHFRYDETPGENTKMAQAMAERHNLELHQLHVPGAWDVFREVGHFFVNPETPEEIAATRRMLAGYKKDVNEYVATQGWTGQFLGLRRAESRSRGIILTRKGALYKTHDRGTWTCCPLADWSGRDVWAYTITRNLPYLSRYDTADDSERERSETTWLAAEALWRYGMAAQLKRDNPEEFYRLAAKWPEIRRYI
jgi:3'-phosphoadenosine 5'-phosphosulfate sulfotransferase (PAPS reductase)/FAD synthetase